MAIQIQVRRGTAAQWTAANTILASGELGLETDTIKWKYGDGATAWAQLPYASVPPGSIVDYAGAYNPATTYHSGEYVVGADGVTYQCVKDNTVGQTPAPWAPAPTLSYATTLPGSPVDGQEAILVDSTTNPTYQWRFRYNAASTSTYKWGFIGGPAAGAEVLGSLTTGSPTYVDVGGPSLAVPRAGIYMVGLGGQINGAGALALNGAGITASDDVGVVNNSTSAITVWIQFRATLTAATAVVYGRQAGAAPTFLRTRFTLIPEKVS